MTQMIHTNMNSVDIEGLTTISEELTAIGEILGPQYWYDKVQRMKPSPEERMERARVLRAEKEERFSEALQDFVDHHIGSAYGEEHKDMWGSCQKEIQGHVIELFETGMGACYSGRAGSGKTHTLLKHVVQLCFREWEEYIKTNEYPQAYAFIEKTVHFGYAVRMSETFERKEDLAQIDKYKRIFSRLLAKCHFYELPAVDRRDPGKKAR